MALPPVIYHALKMLNLQDVVFTWSIECGEDIVNLKVIWNKNKVVPMKPLPKHPKSPVKVQHDSDRLEKFLQKRMATTPSSVPEKQETEISKSNSISSLDTIVSPEKVNRNIECVPSSESDDIPPISMDTQPTGVEKSGISCENQPTECRDVFPRVNPDQPIYSGDRETKNGKCRNKPYNIQVYLSHVCPDETIERYSNPILMKSTLMAENIWATIDEAYECPNVKVAMEVWDKRTQKGEIVEIFPYQKLHEFCERGKRLDILFSKIT